MTETEVLISMLRELETAVYGDGEDDEDNHNLLGLVLIYRSELERQAARSPANSAHLRMLKEGVRLGGWLMYRMHELAPSDLIGFCYGQACNEVQELYALGAQVAHELTRVVSTLEAEYPAEQRAQFDLERARRAADN